MKISPALVLFFLAPAIGELLSGSAPPSEFFNPIGFLLLASLYGSGALLVREMKVRWNKGYVSMFVLGAAYGIVEEGLMVKSFFDPEWMDLGFLGTYGRWYGVNWVWAEWLIIYHAIFSIAIPVTLVELAYPERRNQRWIGNKKLMGLVVLLGAVTLFGYLFLTDYRPPLPQYCLFAATVAFLTLLALKIPGGTGGNGSLKVLAPRKLVVIGFLIASTLFLYFGAGPHFVPQPPILLFLAVGVTFAFFGFMKRYDWNEGTLYHKFALVAGAICFLIVLTPIQELDTNRIDNPKGMLFVGLTALVMLILLRRKLRSYVWSKDSSSPTS